jgi:hypothetical protein
MSLFMAFYPRAMWCVFARKTHTAAPAVACDRRFMKLGLIAAGSPNGEASEPRTVQLTR